ncbi:MAG: hypothetical protein LBI10_05710 [Deltaproteobacteria bacterium]|jgi:hypothetical protein|nr:hypothetical protein [Deltaproteobacteria bacterium]
MIIDHDDLLAPGFKSQLSQELESLADWEAKRRDLQAILLLNQLAGSAPNDQAPITPSPSAKAPSFTVVSELLAYLGWGPLTEESLAAGFSDPVYASPVKPKDQSLGEDQGATPLGFLVRLSLGATLDNGFIAANPYLFLLERLTALKIPFGFLTNGSDWLFTPFEAGPKKSLTFNLEDILFKRNLDDLALFWNFFAVDNYLPTLSDGQSAVASFLNRDTLYRDKETKKLTADLTGGPYSPLVRLSRVIYKADPLDLAKVWELTLRLVFRSLFLAYFEETWARLGEKRSTKVAWPGLKNLYFIIKDSSLNDGYAYLTSLWTLKANDFPVYYKSLLGLRLFDPNSAPLLNQPKLVNDQDLGGLLAVIFFSRDGSSRDLGALSYLRLAAIYESLSSLEFMVAPENMVAAKIKTADKAFFGLFSQDELSQFRQSQRTDPAAAVVVRSDPGGPYLAEPGLNRKTGGVYYTSSRLAAPLVERGFLRFLAGQPKIGSLLELKVLDAAMGTGNILALALDQLTWRACLSLKVDQTLSLALRREIAAIENSLTKVQELEKSPIDEFLVLKRLILRACLYGVDRSPLAVDLSEAALSLGALNPMVAPPFLALNLKRGDSLAGLNLKDLIEGEEPFEGAEKFKFLIDKINDIQSKYKYMEENYFFDEEKFKEYYEKEIAPLAAEVNWYFDVCQYYKLLKITDSAAYFIFKSVMLSTKPENWYNNPYFAEYSQNIAKYRAELSFFHWPLEFWPVFRNPAQGLNDPGGFHIALGNPPWDKTKFEEPLFFAAFRSDYRLLGVAAKKALAQSLLARPEIKARFTAAKAQIALMNAIYRASSPNSRSDGDGNLFRFFLEKALTLLAKGGNLNFIAPSGLLTEDDSAPLRRYIFENYRLVRFDGLENRFKIFPLVDARYKFGLIQIENIPDPTQTSLIRFRLTDPADLYNDHGVYEYSYAELKRTSPHLLAFRDVFGGEKDLSLLSRQSQTFPLLSPKWLSLTNDLHATKDKALFRAIRRPGFLPLYKGATIWQYQAKAKEPEYWLDPQELAPYQLRSCLFQIKADLLTQAAEDPKLKNFFSKSKILPNFYDYLGLKDAADLAQFVQDDHDYPRLAIRAIARDTNARTLVAALLPPRIGSQNSLLVSKAGRYYLDLARKAIVFQPISLERLLFAQGLFNSLVVDWQLRSLVGMNVNKTYLARLSLPQPTDLELAENSLYRELVRDSARLSFYKTPDLLDFLPKALGVNSQELLSSAAEFQTVKASQDLKVAKIYGYAPYDLKYFLASFRVMTTKDPLFVAALLAQIAAAP